MRCLLVNQVKYQPDGNEERRLVESRGRYHSGLQGGNKQYPDYKLENQGQQHRTLEEVEMQPESFPEGAFLWIFAVHVYYIYCSLRNCFEFII